jgi:protein TonB
MDLPEHLQRSRQRAGWIAAVVGLLVTGGSLTWMNGDLVAPKKPDTSTAIAFKVAPPKPPPQRAKPKPRPKPKRTTSSPPPAPALMAGLGGLDFGLPGLTGGMDDATQALLGDLGDVVMTEDAVDVPPRATQRVAPAYPPRARAKDVTGYVTLSLLVSADGAVRDVRVLESQPPGVFDNAAVQAVQGWGFQPAQYQGRDVAVRARQTLRFELE